MDWAWCNFLGGVSVGFAGSFIDWQFAVALLVDVNGGFCYVIKVLREIWTGVLCTRICIEWSRHHTCYLTAAPVDEPIGACHCAKSPFNFLGTWESKQKKEENQQIPRQSSPNRRRKRLGQIRHFHEIIKKMKKKKSSWATAAACQSSFFVLTTLIASPNNSFPKSN